MTSRPLGTVSFVLIILLAALARPVDAAMNLARVVHRVSLAGEIERENERENERDDDDGEGDDDDDHGLEWNDDDHIPGFGRAHGIEDDREAAARVDRELADLKQVKAELDRRIEERRKQLKGAPDGVEPTAAAVDQSKRRVESAKKEASATAAKVTLAERDAMRMLRQLKDEREDDRDELMEIENETAEHEHNVELAAGAVRHVLAESPRYRAAVKMAEGADIRLQQVKEQQKAGRAGPRELVEALNEAKRAKAAVELMESEKLEANSDYLQARQKLAEARQALAKQRAVREASLKADPRFAAAKAAVVSARVEQADVSKTVADASKAKADAATRLERMKKQMKTFEADANRMIAAQRALEGRIKDREILKQELDQKLAGR